MFFFGEAYYKSAALILPIAYRMFDDTVKKNVPGFDWTPAEQHQLEMVSDKWSGCLSKGGGDSLACGEPAFRRYYLIFRLHYWVKLLVAMKVMTLQYKYKMMVLWVVSTVGVLLCMVIIMPQFFDFNDRRGNPSHLVSWRPALHTGSRCTELNCREIMLYKLPHATKIQCLWLQFREDVMWSDGAL